MAKEKEYLQDYDVKSEDTEVLENKLNNDIIVEQKASNFDAVTEKAVIENNKNIEVDLNEYFEK